MAHKVSKKWMRLNYQQHKQHLEDTGDMDMQKVTFEYLCPNVAEILVSPICKYITLFKSNCGYIRTAEDPIFNYVNPLFF